MPDGRGVNGEGSLTLLHLSDLQFGRNHRFGNLAAGDAEAELDTLLVRLENDLALLGEEDPRLRPEAIVVSGDLAEWGMSREFSDARAFLERLAASLEVPHRRVVVVPGNHDLNHKLCEAYFSECEADERTPTLPYARKWEHYLRMFEEFYADDPEIAFTVEEPWTLWEIEELRLVVAGLNSTMRESHRPDDHYGWVGEKQLRRFAERLEPYAERGWFRLGVVHHNTTRGPVSDDENLRDAEKFGELLAPSLNLLLHGHTHDSRITWLGDRPLPVLSTGSAALKSEARPPEVPNQYQLIRLHAGGIERCTRSYDPARGRWAADTRASPDGSEWRFTHDLSFDGCAETFGEGDSTSLRETDAEPAQESEPRVDRESFVGRAMEICELRNAGEGIHIDAMDDDPLHPYLRVRGRDGGIAQSFPIGLVEGDVSKERVDGFCDAIFDRYRALDPSLRCTIVYGGSRATEEVERAAATRNVELRSFVEFQGIIDFRNYVKRQTARLESDPVYPPAMYVPQQLVYEAGSESHTAKDAIAQLTGWLHEPRGRFVLVLGDFGSGKTFMLRELARRMPSDVPHLVPVLVELRALEKARTIEQLVAQHLATAGERFIDLKAFPYMLRKGRIALLVDGFDELAMRVTYKRAADHFDTLLQAAEGDAKVVLTSRTQHFESDRQARSAMLERAELLPGLSLCHVQPFDDTQIVTFLKRRLGDRAKARERYDLLDEIKDLLGLSHNPRMLDFIARIPEQQLREARERSGDITAAELYRLLIDQWLGYEWDKSQPRGMAPALSAEQRWEAVTELALCLWAKLERTIHVSELTEQVSTAVERLSAEPDVGTPPDPDAMAHHVGSRTLLVRDDEGAFEFVHSSVMEWFVASAAASQLAEGRSPEVLAQRDMTELMTDFFCDLAGATQAGKWARETIVANESGSARSNALMVLGRLGEEAPAAVLSSEHLSGRDLSERSLVEANLRGVDLTEARIAGANLSRADLTGASLVRADLTRAALAGADLTEADLRGARLLGADLSEAKLDRANLRRAKLVGARAVDPEALARADTFGAALPVAGTPEPMLEAVESPTTAAAFHPVDELLASGHRDGAVRIWDPATGAELRSLSGHWSWVPAICFSDDGALLASAGSDSTVRVWDPATGVEVQHLSGHMSGVRGVAFSPEGKLLASAGEDGTVRVWDVAEGVQLHALSGHRGWVRGVAFSPDGKLLASGGSDDNIRLWDPAEGVQLRQLAGHRSGTWDVAFSPDGKLLASGGSDDEVRLWNPASGEMRSSLSGHDARVRRVAFSPNGQLLASAGADSTVRIWDPTSGIMLRTIDGQRGREPAIDFSADGQLLAGTGKDESLRLLDPANGAELRTLTGRAEHATQAIAFSPDGRLLARSGGDSTIRLWDAAAGIERLVLPGQRGGVRALAFSPDGRVLASVGGDSTIRLWDRISGVEMRSMSGAEHSIRDLAFSPDGRLLAGAGNGIHCWDPRGGVSLGPLSEKHQGRVRQIAFSPDGRFLASAGRTVVQISEAKLGAEVRSLPGHWLEVRHVAFSPDSLTLASAGQDSTIRLWDPLSGEEKRSLSEHRGGVRCVAFSPDGRFLASAGGDSTIMLWDLDDGTLRDTLSGHRGGVRWVAFSPDGRFLASAGEDGTVRLWDSSTRGLLVTIADVGEGWVAFTPSGRYKFDGRIGGSFWYVLGLCRFALGELDEFLAPESLFRVELGEPL